jgi:succinate dehydrogenase / fumarate reductase, membrane anchor subunit
MADTRNPSHVDMLRSPLGRARGLGSARAGAAQWWGTRLTSLALVPLTLWFICSVIRLTGASREDVAIWLGSPMVMALMLALIIATFHHMASGLQIVIEDYVHHENTRLAGVLLIKAACVIMALACVVSVLRVGL